MDDRIEEVKAKRPAPKVIVSEKSFAQIAATVETRRQLINYRKELSGITPDYFWHTLKTALHMQIIPLPLSTVGGIINEQAKGIVMQHLTAAIEEQNDVLLSFGIEVRPAEQS